MKNANIFAENGPKIVIITSTPDLTSIGLCFFSLLNFLNATTPFLFKFCRQLPSLVSSM
jgi:hypothetical protein